MRFSPARSVYLSQPGTFEMPSRRQVGLMKFSRLSSWWGLQVAEEALLLGVTEADLPLRLANLTEDILERITGLWRIFQASRARAQPRQWLRQQSSLCGGHSPFEVLSEGVAGIEAVIEGMAGPQFPPRRRSLVPRPAPACVPGKDRREA